MPGYNRSAGTAAMMTLLLATSAIPAEASQRDAAGNIVACDGALLSVNGKTSCMENGKLYGDTVDPEMVVISARDAVMGGGEPMTMSVMPPLSQAAIKGVPLANC